MSYTTVVDPTRGEVKFPVVVDQAQVFVRVRMVGPSTGAITFEDEDGRRLHLDSVSVKRAGGRVNGGHDSEFTFSEFEELSVCNGNTVLLKSEPSGAPRQLKVTTYK